MSTNIGVGSAPTIEGAPGSDPVAAAASRTNPPPSIVSSTPPSTPMPPEPAPRLRKLLTRKSKKVDPLQEVPSPSTARRTDTVQQQQQQQREEELESRNLLIRRIILTPVLFVSFLVSLFFVNRRSRAYRAAEHPSLSSSSSSSSSSSNHRNVSSSSHESSPSSNHSSAAPWPLSWAAFLTWLDPEPYRESIHMPPSNPDGIDRAISSTGRPSRHENAWFTKKKHRQVAKLEIAEAFELSGKVVFIFTVLAGVLLTGAVWLAMKAFRTYL